MYIGLFELVYTPYTLPGTPNTATARPNGIVLSWWRPKILEYRNPTAFALNVLGHIGRVGRLYLHGVRQY